MAEVYRLPNGELVDPSELVGLVDPEAPLPTYEQYLAWLKSLPPVS
jgi:hypothetical protein